MPCVRVWIAGLTVMALACGAADPPGDAVPVAPVAAVGPEGLVITGTAPRASGGFASVVSLYPSEPRAVDEGRAEDAALMDQYGNMFHPPVLLVRTGQRVAFQNSEDVLHNVHVINKETRETVFNVATPIVGSYAHRFSEAGVFDVSCQIHPAMAAFVVVTDAPHATVADVRGAFTVSGVLAGDYRVTVWNLDPERRRERFVTIDDAMVLDLTRGEE